MPLAQAILLAVFANIAPEAFADDAPGVVWPDRSGHAAISAPFHESIISIGISRRTAGAINSLTWRGHQFVNANDHGRAFQSASSFDGKGECFNPTEAGSAADATGEQSSSKLLSLDIGDRTFTTKSLMAYWMGPGGRSENCHGTTATMETRLSGDGLTKRISIGSHGLPNVIRYEVIFSIPQTRHLAGFEAVTGYMTPDFKKFWLYDPMKDSLSPQADNTGSQELPLVVSTADENFALGIVSPRDTLPGLAAWHRYGRWDFTQPKMASPTTKWNSYFRFAEIAAGDYAFTTYIVVGSLDDVQSGLRALCKQMHDPGCLH